MTETTKEQLEEQSYIESNRWYITASKLKYFITFWPEAYKMKYIDEIPETNEKDESYFTLGTALDDLLSYWEEFFFEKYAIKEKLLKADLEEKLADKGIEFAKGTGVKELEKLFYGDKILFSQSDGNKIFGMYRELKRQPIVDMWSEYESQKEIIIEYKSLKLKGTLDRLSLEKAMIRDWKTSGQINYFEYNMDTSFGYIMSMAFYYTLVKIKFWVECEAVLDVIWSQPPFPYYGYSLDRRQLLDKLETKIKPALDALIDCIETDTWDSVYPISYTTEGKNGEIIHHHAGDPINRTKLMKSGYYDKLEGWLQEEFITPAF